MRFLYFYINDNVLMRVFGSAKHTFSNHKCAQMSLNGRKKKKREKKKGKKKRKERKKVSTIKNWYFCDDTCKLDWAKSIKLLTYL